MPPESAEELLEALLGDDPGLEPLTALLIERTEGNPFFLEETVRTLVETERPGWSSGARYRLARPIDAIQVPATVQAVLAARIDRLPPEAKRLLQAAAVIGKDVPFALLQAIAEPAEDALRRGLATLQAAEFLYEAGLFPDLEYTFKHALTHEVAYGSLLQDRRRALHGRIVEAIERLYADRLAEQVERLAHHALRGEVWEKAVAYLRQAGRQGLGTLGASRGGRVLRAGARRPSARSPRPRETTELAIDIRLDLRNALVPLDRAPAGSSHPPRSGGARQGARRPAPARAGCPPTCAAITCRHGRTTERGASASDRPLEHRARRSAIVATRGR